MDQFKILIVDDSIVVRNELGSILKRHGFSVIEAEDGNDGLHRLANEPGIDLIIADHYMPSMAGMDMIKKIKSDQRFAKIPIIMITSESSTKLKDIGKENGVMAWALKPYDREAIVELVREMLKIG
ncbi:MAG: response regulator [Oligoflexales bacterium]|nr:response regulator [Oligoflexales bacterium]